MAATRRTPAKKTGRTASRSAKKPMKKTAKRKTTR
jgi:hypothetical protein